MQERYLGDIHDFNKFLYIKFTSKNIKKKIGLNWYLVDPKTINEERLKPNDGEKRNFIYKGNNMDLDNSIFIEMKKLENYEERTLRKFTSSSHLHKFVNFYNPELKKENRKTWFEESLIFFKKNDYLFLDPDNGLIPKSIKAKSKKSIKYIFFSEIHDLLKIGKSVTFCQFQSYSKKFLSMLKEKNELLFQYSNLEINCPIIRNRTSPNTFFITIAEQNLKNLLIKNIEDFANKYKQVELISI